MKSILYAVMLILASSLNAQVVHIVQVANFSFTPDSFTCQPGDTVRFVLVSVSHTATSVSVPAGAQGFDFNLNTSNPADFVVTKEGVYHYKCNFHPSMTASFSVLTSSKPNTSLHNFSIYPMPAKNELNIKSNIGIDAVEIYNLVGKKLVNVKYSNQPIDISSLAPGAYLVRISHSQGSYTQKFTKN